MRKAICVLAVLLGLGTCPTAKEENSKRIALPSSKLLRCKSSDCFLWPGEQEQRNVVYPKQVTLDLDQNCFYGMTVLYDKSVSIEMVKDAVDEGYGKWAVEEFANSPIKLWRVEPEKLAIQLSVADQKAQRIHTADEGSKQVIYMAFGGKSACSVPAN